MIPEVRLEEYTYELPAERIAQFPLPERDRCRLLVARRRERSVEHRHFFELPQILPPGSLLVRNITRVVFARLFLRKPTGGAVELLLLQPSQMDPARGLSAAPPVQWQCLLRGRRVRPGVRLHAAAGEVLLEARLLEHSAGSATVEFTWEPKDLLLAEVLERLGQVPLPPYLRRDATEQDRGHYQTVYARVPGSVAAPTAGLHFTERLLEELRRTGVQIADVCLHVGLDTFKPLRAMYLAEHRMHSEHMSVSAAALQQLIEFLHRPGGGWLVAVGTTSVRTLESLYWHGVRLLRGDSHTWASPSIAVRQWEPYEADTEIAPEEALSAVLEWMRHHGSANAEGTTELMIVPGYIFRLCDAIITNFHQPQSTLLLLVGAFLGRTFWRQVYEEALHQGYRFLSYGDASLLVGRRGETVE